MSPEAFWRMEYKTGEVDVLKNKIALKWGQGHHKLCSDTVWAPKEEETDEGPEKLEKEKFTGQESLTARYSTHFFTLSCLIFKLTGVTIF